MDEMKFELAVSTNDWSEAHKLLSTMPAGTGKRFSLAMMASKEAEAGASQAEADLIEAAKEYDAKHDPPSEGYLIASHLAALRDYDHALQAAEKVRDDEWNAKAWSSIAAFQAVDRKVTEAKMSIAWIGKGELEHALGDPEHRRDMAKVFVASALSTAGHPDMALALLADRETKADDFVIDREFELEKVHALASKGDISAARMLVEKSLSHVVVVDDNESSLAWLLVENWYRIQSADAEQWIQLQQNASIRSTSWLAAASVALKSNPQPVYYFMNWD